MKNYTNIGEVIKFLRKENQLSQADLADGICSREYLGKIERGENCPTFEVVNQLSDKLGINIYDNYAMVLEHHGITTHKHIEHLNELIFQKDLEKLHSFTQELSKLDTFSYGVPYKFLKYSQAIYASYQLNDYSYALELALEGLNSDVKNFLLQNPNTIHLGTSDLILAQCVAINYCRQNEFDQGKLYFKFLFEYLKKILSSNRYIINRNNRFELNFLAHVVYNYYVFFRNTVDSVYKTIESTIIILKEHNFSNLMPELLFCKSQIELDNGTINESLATLQTARCLAEFLYGKDKAMSLENEILMSSKSLNY